MCVYRLLLVLSIHVNNVLTAQILDKPTEDVILQPGGDYTFTCKGAAPVNWTTPQVDDSNKGWTTFQITNEQSLDNLTISTLYITNMSYPFVGYYSCKDNEGIEDNLYLYVNDSEHLSVMDFYKIVVVYKKKEATLPCRPTSPDVKVTLVDLGNDEVLSFNPRKGFLLYIKRPVGDHLQICRFTRGNSVLEKPLVMITELDGELNTPLIKDESNNHTEVGETLTLVCLVKTEFTNLNFEWKTPRGTFTFPTDRDEDVEVQPPVHIENETKWASKYVVENSTIHDSGLYSCDVSTQEEHKTSEKTNIVVHSKNECYVSISEENDQTYITADVDEPVQIILNVFGHPNPKVQWYYNNKEEVTDSNEFEIQYTGLMARMIIKNAQLKHTGTYKLVATSEKESLCREVTEYSVELHMRAKPTICLTNPSGNCKSLEKTSQVNFLVNEMVQLNFKASGSPLPQINCTISSIFEDAFLIPNEENCPLPTADFEIWSCYRIIFTRDGEIVCNATNNLGTSSLWVSYYISDVKNGFDLYDFSHGAIIRDDNIIVAANEEFNFTCGVALKKSKEIEIFFNDDLPDERHFITEEVNGYSKALTVYLPHIQLTDSGEYSCRIRNIYDNSFEFRNISLHVEVPRVPFVVSTNLEDDVVVDYPKMPKQLTCFVNGTPKPDILWFKDDKIIETSDRVMLQHDNQTLFFNHTEVEDEGTYRCEAKSSIGFVFRQGKLRIRVKDVSLVFYFAAIALISVFLIVALIYIIVRRQKEQELRKKLKALGLENFEKGDPTSLNPDLGIDDQAELLPYNRKFEFPFENLKLGKQLGSGAYGVVMKAEAKGLIPGEPVSIVAVKMVKKNADHIYIKALASELKIMVHLGKHINVVNLLGACTKNVAKMELYVIVEFCRFGNLQRYLYQHRDSYINQVDEVTGKINYHIGADVLNRAYSVTSDCNSRTYSVSTQDYTGNAPTLTTQLSCTGESAEILSNNSSQPDWRFNYKGDYKGDVKPICTKDLLIWSFQLARGMEYLASRNVLHGDLAARNILLAENNVVKICDFGLAKTMYNSNNYKKKGNTPLPIKWMSIESIRDRVFSTQSDVWSFGIVLWEFFSLAKTPYPGMEPDEHFYNKLVQGYRLEPPPYSPKEINQIMSDCWNAKPMARPSFTKLAKTIGDLLDSTLKKYYIDLNDPYFKANTQNLDEDYLAMVGSPNFEVISTPPPHYENVQSAPLNLQQTPGAVVPEGYLEMRPLKIFSPRVVPNEGVFHFPQSEVNSPSDDELESNTGYLEPITPVNSVSNPLYNHLGSIKPNHSARLIETPDNYISMPEYKNLLRKNSEDKKISSDNTSRNLEQCEVLLGE